MGRGDFRINGYYNTGNSNGIINTSQNPKPKDNQFIGGGDGLLDQLSYCAFGNRSALIGQVNVNPIGNGTGTQPEIRVKKDSIVGRFITTLRHNLHPETNQKRKELIQLLKDNHIPKEAIDNIAQKYDTVEDFESRIEAFNLLKETKDVPKSTITAVLESDYDKDSFKKAPELFKKLCTLPMRKQEILRVSKEFDTDIFNKIFKSLAEDKNANIKLEILDNVMESNELPMVLADQFEDFFRSINDDNIEIMHKFSKYGRKLLRYAQRDSIPSGENPKEVYKKRLEVFNALTENCDMPKEALEMFISQLKMSDEPEIVDANIELARLIASDKKLKMADIMNSRFHNWGVCSYAFPIETIQTKIDAYKKLSADKKFPKNEIANLLYHRKETIDAQLKIYDLLVNDKEIDPKIKADIVSYINEYNVDNYENLCKNYKEIGIIPDDIILLQESEDIKPEQLVDLRKAVGNETYEKLTKEDKLTGIKFSILHGKQDINEIPASDKKGLLKELVSSNYHLFRISDDLAKEFPLIPKKQEEYCELLPAIVKSMGIDITPLKPEQRIEDFNNSLFSLADSLEDGITVEQDYPKEEFIKTVSEKIKDLPETERQKLYDYFGFELHGENLVGYPANLNNGKKLERITDPNTKAVVEDLRSDVIRFSENNTIHCDNKTVEKYLNEVASVLPETHTMVSDIMNRSLNVMHKIAQNPKFKELNESDRKIMLLAALLHDINPAHEKDGAFDTFFITKKFNLSKSEE